MVPEAEGDLGSGGVRVDRWLWSIRMFRTRSAAAAACRGGHVKVNGRTAKPSRLLAPGDRIAVRHGQRSHDLEVLRLIDKRVGAAVAVRCYEDHAPPPAKSVSGGGEVKRERGSGRPTKKERRETDRLRGRRS